MTKKKKNKQKPKEQDVEKSLNQPWLSMRSGMKIIAITSLVLGINGWDINRIWLYLLGSAMLILFGFQLVIYWGLVRALQELSQRETLAQNDLQAI